MEISAEHRDAEGQLLTRPYKHNAIILFRKLYKGVKMTSTERFEKFKEYCDDLVKREVITEDWATKWKAVNPWPTRPGPLE